LLFSGKDSGRAVSTTSPQLLCLQCLAYECGHQPSAALNAAKSQMTFGASRRGFVEDSVNYSHWTLQPQT